MFNTALFLMSPKWQDYVTPPPDIDFSTYSQFLEEKRVALIGPSQSIEGTLKGELIDSYDVIVRMIRPRRDTALVPKRLEKDIGTITHVIYSNFDDVILTRDYLRSLVKQRVKYLNSTRPIGDHYKDQLKEEGLFFCDVTPTKHEKWTQELRSGPHSGFCVLLDLLSYNIKELYILGYSFYKDAVIEEWVSHNNWTQEGYESDAKKVWEEGDTVSANDDIRNWRRENSHNNRKELIYFKKEILAKDPRVKVDDSMLKFLK